MRGLISKSVEQLIKSYCKFVGKSVVCALSFSGHAVARSAWLLTRPADIPELFPESAETRTNAANGNPWKNRHFERSFQP